jgi:hypothetical protein
MENKRLFNWEIEKKIKEFEGSLQFKEATIEDIEVFVLEHNYYNGDSEEVFVILCNAYHKRARFDKLNEIFVKLFEKWKVLSNKFSTNIQRQKYLADLVISKIAFIPEQFVAHLKKQDPSELQTIIGCCIDRYLHYKKTELLGEFLEQMPYQGSDIQTLFNLINAGVELKSNLVNEYLNKVFTTMKDPIAFLNNIKFTSEFFSVVNSETLKKILDLPGISTKFNQFIKFESFMESLDKIPSLPSKFFISISNQLYEKNTAMAIQYGIRAIRKPDFVLEEDLQQINCCCDNDPKDQPSIAELLMISSLKEGNYKRVWTIIEKSYFIHARAIAQLDVALKYTAAAVKVSNANSEMIARHIQFLARRIRSADGTEGILEGDRYKHKEENQIFNKQMEAYRALYLKKTGKKFLI